MMIHYNGNMKQKTFGLLLNFLRYFKFLGYLIKNTRTHNYYGTGAQSVKYI